ncbi:MAG: hypothetical protein HGA71_18060 [Azonexaceae bacterium]|nr:hypothetical protein [Azonexaceae bacterium]
MTMPLPETTEYPARWREPLRFLLATLAITLLYLGIQAFWMWGAAELAHVGWTVNDPARTYAEEAAEIAEKSQPREQTLDPQFPRRVFVLGFEYGYLSQWLGGYGQQPAEIMAQLSRPVEGHIRRLDETAVLLGVAPVSLLPVRTAADFSGLTQRIEDDPEGVAGRVEQSSSPRLRHVFLLAAHVGTMSAALESPPAGTMPIPATQLIGMHGVLGGIPEALWRPLGRVSRGTPEEVRRDYNAAATRLEAAL